jgi:hypothetical protein
MEFRWVAIIALWTVISGPIVSGPSGATSARSGKPGVGVVKSSKPLAIRR